MRARSLSSLVAPLLSLALSPALSWVLSSVALAQQEPLRGEPPTRGPEIPTRGLAGATDAFDVALNPSNLAFLRGWSAGLLYTQLDGGGVRGPGGGGLYLATPLPLLDRVSVGAAVELVRPPDAFPYGDETRLSFALAVRLLPSLTLGATYTHLYAGDTPALTSPDTLDLGATGRIGRYAALALVVRDVPSPGFGGLGVQRVYQPELVLRPTGDERFELAVSARIGERHGVNPALRFVVTPTPGLRLRGAVELAPDLYGDARAVWDVRASAGLELDLAHVGVGAYGLFGGNAGGARWDGLAFMARASGERYAPLLAARRLERIDLAGGDPRRMASLLAHLGRLEREGRTDGILVVMGDVSGSWATMEELRDAFARLRAAGKHVYVYAADLSTKSWYAAAAAERVYLDPAGGVRLVGFATTTLYLKGALDQLGVRAEFVKIAEYKSAPEQYMRAGPSDEARAVREALLSDIEGRLLAAIEARPGAVGEAGREAAARRLVDAGPYTARGALAAGLVDELRGGDEIEAALGERLGHPVRTSAPPSSPERARTFSQPAIAVVHLDGDMVSGRSRTIPLLDRHMAGHQTLIAAIEQARGDDRVEAIVLRIDSPGGSALAADLIAREVERTRKVKPVVCSLGDTAASGGYYVAAACDVIYAEPSTITGSIGIFSGKVDLSGLAGKLGVDVATGRRGAHADMESMWRPYTDEEKASLLETLRSFYDRFVATVARGRHLPPTEVDAVGRGHVWTGAQALERRLVDRLGGFAAALGEAKRRAGRRQDEAMELVMLPSEPTSLLGQLAELAGIGVRAELPSLADVPALRTLLGALPASLAVEPDVPQARLAPDAPLP